MKPSSSRWASTLTGIAIVALPLTCFAQAQPPAAPPSAQTEQQAAAPADANQVAAKAHLTAARNTLSQLTQLPAAGQLQGEARAQVSQLINNFNELITTQTDWKASYAKVAANLEALIGPSSDDAARPTGTAGATGTPGAVGTSGTTGMAAIDPAVRAKLTEFRSELDEFQKAAQKAPQAPQAMSGSAAAPAPSAAPSAPAPTPAPPSAPSARPAATPAAPGTERTTAPTAPEKAVEDPQTPDSVNLNPQDILQHIEAMEVIINAQSAAQGAAQAAPGAVSTTTTPSGSTRTTVTPADVTLNQAQIAELKNHLAELRRLVDKK